MNHLAFSETFHANAFTEFVNEFFYFLGVANSLSVAIIKVNACQKSPAAIFFEFFFKLVAFYFFKSRLKSIPTLKINLLIKFYHKKVINTIVVKKFFLILKIFSEK